jgi:hypothetical protein
MTGGGLSLQGLSIESPIKASERYNIACINSLDNVAYWVNLLQGSVGSLLNSIQRELGLMTPCGGLCLPESPVCKPLRSPNASRAHPDFAPGGILESTTCYSQANRDLSASVVDCPTFDTGYSCTQPDCTDAAPYCNINGRLGILVRQVCPLTCGCHLPRSTLALSLPETGCTPRCTKKTEYKEAMRTIPCTDVPRNDSNFVGFLENFQVAARVMARDWGEASVSSAAVKPSPPRAHLNGKGFSSASQIPRVPQRVYIDLFSRFGCAYLSMQRLDDVFRLGIDWRAAGLINSSTFLCAARFQSRLQPLRRKRLLLSRQASLPLLSRRLWLPRRR